MTTGIYQHLNQINQPVTIQDIVVTGYSRGNAGEFNCPWADATTEKTRLYTYIEYLASMAAGEHRRMNFGNSLFLQPGRENNITRLVTNEFAFYTQKPLSIAEFNELAQRISTLAKQLPQNLHLVLSSFAVRTPENKVMNVVAQVECGVVPKLSLMVKNHPSHIDPVYSENTNGYRARLPNIDVTKNDRVDLYYINVNGTNTPFTFKSVTECKTAGGAKFHSCIDVCLDHSYGVAKKHLNNTLTYADQIQPNELLAIQCSHIVTSNWIGLFPKNAIGEVTHADPVCSKVQPKQGASMLRENPMSNIFGATLRAFVTSPTVCSRLPSYEQSLVDKHNNKVLNAHVIATTPKPVAVSPKPTALMPIAPAVVPKHALKPTPLVSVVPKPVLMNTNKTPVASKPLIAAPTKKPAPVVTNKSLSYAQVVKGASPKPLPRALPAKPIAPLKVPVTPPMPAVKPKGPVEVKLAAVLTAFHNVTNHRALPTLPMNKANGKAPLGVGRENKPPRFDVKSPKVLNVPPKALLNTRAVKVMA